ncbi:MAG: hypothetical protein ACRERC_27410 [Candidatus Binatia bacterium]
MGKVTIGLTLISTTVLLIAFGKGMGILHGGDVASHLYWSVATLVTVLSANFITMLHAAQSDRIIRELRVLVETRAEDSSGAA